MPNRVMVLSLVLTLTACSSGPKNFLNDNDKLRRENLDLKRQVDDLNAALQRRVDEVATLEQQLADNGDTNARAPRLTTVKLGRYSGVVDTDGYGAPDLFRLFVVTLDQDGRFLPIRAEAVVRVVELPVEGEPRLIVRQEFSPVQVKDNYRSGFTGTHYRLEVALPADTPPDFTVRVTLVESDGLQVSAEGAFTR